MEVNMEVLICGGGLPIPEDEGIEDGSDTMMKFKYSKLRMKKETLRI